MKNPYQYIKNNIAVRPFTQNGEKDGKQDYIAREDALALADEIVKTRQQVNVLLDLVKSINDAAKEYSGSVRRILRERRNDG